MRTTSSPWLLGMAEQFQWMGLPVLALFQQANIALSSLTNPSVRVPQNNVSQLWKAAEQASGREAIGLLVGQELSAAPIAAVGLLECTNAVAAIELVLRYQKMIGESSNIQMTQLPRKKNQPRPVVRLDFLFYDDQMPLSVHTRDVAMASTVRAVRLVEGRDWTPIKVQMSRRVRSAAAHQAYYNCEVLFDQGRDSLFFELNDSSEDERIAQLGLANIVEPSGESGPPQALAEMIAMVLPEQLRSGQFKRPHIARLFNMSERTLQRRLAREGLSFSKILDRVRKNKSHELLCDTDYSQIEVAFLCGFSDLSAFHHAFQRWFDEAPGLHRDKCRGRDRHL